MDLIRQVMKTRQEMYTPKPAEKKPSVETDGLTLATIIEDKPKKAEVVKYFRLRADQLDGSS
jgi:hypothetical protein